MNQEQKETLEIALLKDFMYLYTNYDAALNIIEDGKSSDIVHNKILHTDTFMWKSLKRDPYNILHLPYASHEMKIYALQIDPEVIDCFKNPEVDLQVLAISKKPTCIEYIKNPCDQVIKIAVEKLAQAGYYINKLSPENQSLYFKHHPSKLEFLETPSTAECLIAYEYSKTLDFASPTYKRYIHNLAHSENCPLEVLWGVESRFPWVKNLDHYQSPAKAILDTLNAPTP